MRYFYVCPHCLAKVEYEDALRNQFLQCTCENVWQFTDDVVMSEFDYKREKSTKETQFSIELNHSISCPLCKGELPYKLSMMNKPVRCSHCQGKFSCTAKNVLLQ